MEEQTEGKNWLTYFPVAAGRQIVFYREQTADTIKIGRVYTGNESKR
jgi:hypothetical protein